MDISAITLQKIQQNGKDHDGKYEKLRRKYENTISVKCPTCNNYFEVDVFRAYSMGVSFNCPHCNSILRIRKNLKNGVDKRPQLCYNKDTVKERRKPNRDA